MPSKQPGVIGHRQSTEFRIAQTHDHVAELVLRADHRKLLARHEKLADAADPSALHGRNPLMGRGTRSAIDLRAVNRLFIGEKKGDPPHPERRQAAGCSCRSFR